MELPVFAEEGESVRDDDVGSKVVQEDRAGECSTVGDSSLSARNFVNFASPDCSAQAIVDWMLLLWSASIPITLQVLVTTECSPLSAAMDTI